MQRNVISCQPGLREAQSSAENRGGGAGTNHPQVLTLFPLHNPPFPPSSSSPYLRLLQC
jgi:hypothetical protein